MRFNYLGRREFITLLSGAAAWPLTVRAQPPKRMRRVGVLLSATADDLEYQARVGAFAQELRQLGWSIGQNVEIETQWATSNIDAIRTRAAEIIALMPDVVLANGDNTVGALQQVTRTTPIVFVGVADPIGAGFAQTLGHPGGNATGFLVFEYGISVKWLELLKEMVPNVRRAVVLRDPSVPVGLGQFGAIQGIAPSLNIDVSPIDVRDVGGMEGAIAAFARSSNGGLVTLPGAVQLAHRKLIIELAARYRLPAVYPYRYHAVAGGLVSYGPDTIEPFRQAAHYVDRILKGEKAADLPVQAPTKYNLVLNLKTAKALGLDVPASLLARADEVIE
jgi:putative tryptophan/tyrosine transport system substrate-binding protein